jgi:hypothetical protein
MKKYIFLLFCFIATSTVFPQQSIITFSIQNAESKPLEDVIVSSLTTNDFYYSDKNGNLLLKYKTDEDRFKMSIPSFEDEYYTISEIKALNNLVQLKEKAIVLDEILVTSRSKKSNILYKLKAKKQYFFNFTSPGGSIVSPYLHKTVESDTLSSISFFFDHTKIEENQDIKIRLLIFKDDKKWKPLLESPTVFFIDSERNELNISFKNSKIIMEERQNYLLGFELINKEKSNTVEVLSTSIKNTISYLKPSPNQKWFQLEPEKPKFSLYYEIYFKE